MTLFIFSPLGILLLLLLIVAAVEILRLRSKFETWKHREITEARKDVYWQKRRADNLQSLLDDLIKATKEGSLTFAHFQNINQRRSDDLFPMCYEWEEPEWMMALTGELGELANMLKKRLRDQVGPSLEEVGEEVADVLCYLFLLASYLDLDMEKITRDKFNKVTARFSNAPNPAFLL